MTESSAPPPPREDVLVSVCFSEFHPTPETLAKLKNIASAIDACFRFREIIVISDVSLQDQLLPIVQQISNVRLITVQDAVSIYQRRVIAADEAIGDVVVITNSREASFVDLLSMITRAADDDVGITSVRDRSGFVDQSLSATLTGLGKMAGFSVALRNLQTIALPRTQLNQLLAHEDPELALRFPPRDPRISMAVHEAENNAAPRRDTTQLYMRLVLLQKILTHVAPKLLLAVTIASALLCLLGLGYALYVIFAWAFIENLQPGWLTTSMMLSLTASFLGAAITGLSLGLQQLLILLRRDKLESVVTEVNRIDLFSQVTEELNIDLEREEIHPDPGRGS